MTAATIHEAIAGLHAIADRAAEEGSRMGYFAALYARVTEAVAGKIEAGFFEDGPWMERLDVLFASRYLEAVERHRRGEEVMACWRVALEACGDRGPTVLQHLYLGMNAHLLLDLPIALVEACEGGEIAGRRGDFKKINEIVSGLMPGFHEDLGRASPWLGAWERRAGWAWAAGSRGVLVAAREMAWRGARQIAGRCAEERPALIAAMDAEAARRGREILDGGPIGRRLYGAMRAGEGNEVRATLAALRAR